jgi:hypothetical protein
MSSETVCEVTRRWVNVGSFHTRLFGVCGDFHDGSEKGTASEHQILCQSSEKCYGDPQWFNKLSGTKSSVVRRCFDSMPGSRPVAHKLTMTNTKGDPQTTQLLKMLHEFKSSSVRIDVDHLRHCWGEEMGMGYGTCQRVLTKGFGIHRVAASPLQRPFSHFVLTQPVLARYQMVLIPTHRTPPIWHPVTSFYFHKWNWRLTFRNCASYI